MKTLLSILLALLLHTTLPAQSLCPDLLGKAQTALKQGEYNRARDYCETALPLCPEQAVELTRVLDRVNNAIEQQKKDAIDNARRAKQKEAEARQALAALEKSSAEVVAAYLGQARDLIYHLQYAEAEIQIKKAAAIGVKKAEVARALLEIAYVHAHTGRTDSAQSEALLVARLRGAPLGPVARVAPPKADSLLLAQLRALDPALFDTLRHKYFPEMLPVPGGVFWMGRDSSVEDGNESELPRHPVELSPYALAKTETTLWQYGLFCAAEGRAIKEKHNESWGSMRGDDPVIYISWYDAVAYANWCSVRQGLQPVYHIDSSSGSQVLGWLLTIPDSAANGYRLPTEAEWERAARYAPSGEYVVYSGAADASELDSVAWYNRNSSRTNPVGTKRPNALGLHDLSGNVWEWCWNWYGAYPSRPVSNPKGPAEGSDRVLRGGGRISNADYCRVARRLYDAPESRDNYVGFRVARSPQ